jgi:hypothetical protein
MGHSLTKKLLLGFLSIDYLSNSRNILGRFLFEDLIPDRKLGGTA